MGEQGGGSYKCLYHLPLLQGAANFTHIYFKVQLVGNLLLLGFLLEYNFYFLLNKHGIIKKKRGAGKDPRRSPAPSLSPKAESTVHKPFLTVFVSLAFKNNAGTEKPLDS